jgi:hypothetical protein
MAHHQQREWIASVRHRLPDSFNEVQVLDVGSLNINGSARDFFDLSNYTGIDVGPGPGVDLVISGHEADFPNEHFDVVLSAECFEHNEFWAQTFLNMHRMSSDLVLVSCATTGRPEHGTARTSPQDSPYTNNYYKNLTPQDFVAVFDLDAMFAAWEFQIDNRAHDLYFLGIKH